MPRKKPVDELFAQDTSVITQEAGKNWALYNGDSCVVLPQLPDKSIDLSVFSIPFASLYTYSDTPADLGNCATPEEFIEHCRFIVDQLLRVTKPGRNACCHIQDTVTTVATNGIRGIDDFTGRTCVMFQEAGFSYCGKIAIDQNPQCQAARNKVHELMFATKNRDATNLVPVMLAYVQVFKAPGKNEVPVVNPIDNETWIDWAHGIWPEDGRRRVRKGVNDGLPYVAEWEPRILPFYDIRETDVLNTAVAKSKNDERHLCPLQLGLIERLIKLYTNPKETVLDCFSGVGSTVYEAVKNGRRGVGIELNPAYHRVAVRNVKNAECANLTLSGLFDEG